MTALIHPGDRYMGRRDGFLLTSLVWILFSAFGMLPFLFSGSLTTVADAYFETMSGFTTTGSTMCGCGIDVARDSILASAPAMDRRYGDYTVYACGATRC